MLGLLDTRAFGSLWYWLVLTGIWTWVGRGALGVPTDVVRAVLRGPAPEAQERLLDWLAVVLPRWRVAPRDGVVLVAAGSFALSALAVLGFWLGREWAQALVLLTGPLAVLGVLRVRLAARLRSLLAEAPDDAPAAASVIAGHLRQTLVLSVIAVGLAALIGTRWLALHPFGV